MALVIATLGAVGRCSRVASAGGGGGPACRTGGRRAAHLVVNAVAPDVLRLSPPLNVSIEEADLALEILGTAIAEAFTAAGVLAPHATSSRTS